MATLRLTPSSYQLSNTSYLSISNAQNMYTNVDSSTMATVSHNRTQTTSYYIYIRGFDFSQIPDEAIINSVIVKVRAYVQGAGSYTPALYNNTSSLSTNFNGTIGTSATTRTVDITSKFDTFKSYGNNFGIRLQLNRSSKNTASKMYIYGAEIAIEYTLPIKYNITTSASGCTISPSGSTEVYNGESINIKIEGSSKPTVTDNGIDVTSKLIEKEASLDYDISDVSGASYGFNLNSSGYYESTNKGISSSTSLCRVNVDLPVECTVRFRLINYAESTCDYGLLSNIDSPLSNNASADSSGVYWSGRNNNSASEQIVEYTVPSGEHFIYIKYFKDSYTNSYNDSLQFKVEIIPNKEWSAGVFWEYVLTNINENHNIVATLIEQPVLYIKINGSWKRVLEVGKKNNGVWIKQTNLEDIFDINIKYVQG